MISFSCGSQYMAPSISACHVGCMNPVSCSNVDVRNTGLVSRMKSVQNCPAACSGASGGGGRGEVDEVFDEAEWLEASAHDASAANTTLWPPRRKMLPIPMQLFVGP